MYHLTWFSQDTVEAKLLQPAIDADVTLYEDVARTARYIAKNKVLRQISPPKKNLGQESHQCYVTIHTLDVGRGAQLLL